MLHTLQQCFSTISGSRQTYLVVLVGNHCSTPCTKILSIKSTAFKCFKPACKMLVKLTPPPRGEQVRLRVKTCLNVSQRVVSLSLRHLMRCQFQVEQKTEGKETENEISRKFSFFNANINAEVVTFEAV